MMRLCCLSLSFQNQFKAGKMDVFKFIEHCRALNFDGVDPHFRDLPPTKDGMKRLRRLLLDTGLSMASMCTAPLGARVAHNMDIAPLKRAFAVVLYGLAAYFVLR